MKIPLPFFLAVLALFATGVAIQANAADQPSAGSGKKIYLTVVAEQADPAAKATLPTPDHPGNYIAYDAGYIEEGDPVAGENPPTAAAVAQALRASLAVQNFLPATAPSAPSLALIYHWGVLRPDSYQVRSDFKIQPNLHARLALVATTKQTGDIENFIMARRMGRINPAFRVPGFLNFRERDLLDLARDDRYFVIVSAYDFAALTRREAKLVWRVRVSTRGPGAAMAEALPALLSAGGPFFGRNLEDTQTIKAPLFPASRVEGGPANAEASLPPPEIARQIDEHCLHGLIRQERIEFSGTYASDAKDSDPPPPKESDASGASFLPPALAARIDGYQHDKSDLQNALSVRIKERTPGVDTRQAIDAFNQENAGRIAALTKEREAIRDDLARLAAANTDSATGKSLNALLKEFAADVKQTSD
jgi:hypothetical protein